MRSEAFVPRESVLVHRGLLKSDKDWQAIFDATPGASVFQSPDWARRMERCLGSHLARPYSFEFADGTQVVWPTLQRPMRRVFNYLEAMPLGIYGTPIIRGEWSPEKGREILRSVLAGRCLEMRYVEDPTREALSFLLPSGVTQQVRLTETHILDLPATWDTMWQTRFSKNMRNQVRKAEKQGLTLRRGRSAAEVDSFYRLYQECTKIWGYGRPPHSREYFLTLMDNAPDALQLLLVEDHGKAVAGSILVEDAESVLAWYGAMDRIVAKKCPTRFLLSHVVREAIGDGKKYLNMGASGHLEGVRTFKELWHCRPVAYSTIVFRRQHLMDRIDGGSRILRRVWKRE